ncbi:dnaJ homolog subfamily B member 1-like [Salvia splendens]|uniref:dnaJ homolog subfamily B member 1-like n=1 Tax=Salvia splendens TaxID=180675 RepID=UPI001103CB73|nr:dnaJ homolog subfamily B member 1-like [Salvia splendens]
MGDSSKSQTSNWYNVLGIPKSASLSEICKAYKSLVKKWHPDRNPSNKIEAEAKFRSINEAYRALSLKKREEDILKKGGGGEGNGHPSNGERKPKHKKKKSHDCDKANGFQISHPTLLSRTTSRTSPLTSPTLSSRRNNIPPAPPFGLYPLFVGDTPTAPSTPEDLVPFSKVASRRCSTPIFFSQSAARVKPPPVQKKIECTLEELCLGCVKNIKITRDAISSSGLIVEEEEILTIQVQPGWKKGTKITFEGKGDEKPGTLPADLVFSVVEKKHPLFRRDGDDLELGLEVPLVQALSGCTTPIPLLGGGQMTVSIDDIIYPGYEKNVPGQGMPISKQGNRGNLRLKFLVEFPAELSNDQRVQIVNILEGCSSSFD